MFLTNSLKLCIDRAAKRHASGGHEVKPEIIVEMYQNTFPLFGQNKNLFHSVRMMNVTNKSVR